MELFDVIVCIVIFVALFSGMRKGLVLEAAGLVAIGVGLWGAQRFASVTVSFMHEQWGVDCSKIVAFAITFLLVVVAVHLILKMFNSMINATPVSIVNKLGGAIFCAAKWLMLVGSVIYVATKYAGPDALMSEEKQEVSMFYRPIQEISVRIIDTFDVTEVKDAVKEGLDNAASTIERKVGEVVEDKVKQKVDEVIDQKIDEFAGQ